MRYKYEKPTVEVTSLAPGDNFGLHNTVYIRSSANFSLPFDESQGGCPIKCVNLITGGYTELPSNTLVEPITLYLLKG